MKNVNVVRQLPLGGADLQSVAIEGGEVQNLQAFIHTFGNIVAIKPEGIVNSMFNTVATSSFYQRGLCWGFEQFGLPPVMIFFFGTGLFLGVASFSLYRLSGLHRVAIIQRVALILFGFVVGAISW